jgi:hypothetical protein
MSILGNVFKELLGMFLADARLTLATLCLVAIIGGLVSGFGVGPFIAGGILLVGCLAILIEAASREARERGQR